MDNQCSIIVGQRGSGKTEYCKKVIRTILSNRPGIKALIITDSDADTWHYLDAYDQEQITPIPVIELDSLPYLNQMPGRIYRTTHYDMSETLRIAKYLHSVFILVEDASREFDEGKLPKFVRQMILNTKQHNVDMLWVYHLLVQLPFKLVSYSNTLTIFKTGETVDSALRKKIRHPNLTKIVELINDPETPKYTKATLSISS
jgi:hypothetical protein